MKKIIGLFLFGYMVFNFAYADSDNDCGNFHIQISNLTKEPCILSCQKIIHGNLTTPPPLSILPNDSKRFDMSQTMVYGPAITLSYQCGAEIVSFTSQQNLCAWEAGDVTGTLLHPLPLNTTMSYTALPGSYFWGKPGSINWKILDQRLR